MLEALLRPKIQRYTFDPLARWIHQHTALHANHITGFSGLMGLLIPLACLGKYPLLALLLLLLSGVLDALDGTLARLENNPSSIGIVYDIVSDRVVEWMMIFGLYLLAPHRDLACLLMLGSVLLCVTSFLVVGIVSNNHSNKGFHYSPGLMERPEAFFFWGSMLVFPQAFNGLAILFTLLVLYTTIKRIWEFRAQMLDSSSLSK